MGYEPKESFFYELTADQYSQLEREHKDISKRWYAVIPKDPRLDIPETLIVDEDQKKALLDAAQYIYRFCKNAKVDTKLESFEGKLRYAASQLPTVFSASTKYEKYAHANTIPDLKLVK